MPDMFSEATNDVPLVASWTTTLPPPVEDTVDAVLSSGISALQPLFHTSSTWRRVAGSHVRCWSCRKRGRPLEFTQTTR
jgi:hypothetical protein